jgi:hypothetical protein
LVEIEAWRTLSCQLQVADLVAASIGVVRLGGYPQRRRSLHRLERGATV